MILVSQKRVVMSLSLTLLIFSIIPLKARHNDAGDFAVGCAIGAGILGLCGLAAGIAYACSKSDEQIAQEAEQVVRDAHRDSQRFYAEYVQVFMRGLYSEPTFIDVEQNFLSVIALKAYNSGYSIDTYINTLAHHKTNLAYALDQVNHSIENLERKGDQYKSVYAQLIYVRRALTEELAWLAEYYPKFADHRAFFNLYAFESALYAVYATEFQIGYQYPYDPYLFEFSLMQAVASQDLSSQYPIIAYYTRLNEHIETVQILMQELRYTYVIRIPEAQQLLDYLVRLRGVIGRTTDFKNEKQRKKADDDHREWCELQRREIDARMLSAQANMQRAQAAYERNRIERVKLDQPHLVIINNN